MMYKIKNYILFSLIILSQSHVAFRDSEISIEWLLNGKIRSLTASVFLFVKHFSEFYLVFCLLKPKGLDRNLILLLLILTFLDVWHFILFSGKGFEIEKLVLTGLMFFAMKTKFNKWLK